MRLVARLCFGGTIAGFSLLASPDDGAAQCRGGAQMVYNGTEDHAERQYGRTALCRLPHMAGYDDLVRAYGPETIREFGFEYAAFLHQSTLHFDLETAVEWSNSTRLGSSCTQMFRSLASGIRQWAEAQIWRDCGARPPYCDTSELNNAFGNLADELAHAIDGILGSGDIDHYSLSESAFNSTCTRARRRLKTFSTVLSRSARDGSPPYHQLDEAGRDEFERRHHRGSLAMPVNEAGYLRASRLATEAWTSLSNRDQNLIRSAFELPERPRCAPDSGFERDVNIEQRIDNALWRSLERRRKTRQPPIRCSTAYSDYLDWR